MINTEVLPMNDGWTCKRNRNKAGMETQEHHLLRNDGGLLSGFQRNALASQVHSVVWVTKWTRDGSALHWRPERRLPSFRNGVVFLSFFIPALFLPFLQVHPYLKWKACPHLIWIQSTSISQLNPLHAKLDQSALYYKLKTRDNSYTRPSYGHVIVYLPLTSTQSCFWIIHSAGFGHCLLPIHTTTTFVSCTLQLSITDQHLQTSASINKRDCHVITSFPVIIHFPIRST